MNQTIIPSTATATFVIRFTREAAAGEVRWRGCIEHVQSGENASFLGMEGLLTFLRRYGIMAEEQN
jgi:hypothetical protein